MTFGFGRSQGFGNSGFGNNNNSSGFGANSGSSLFGGGSSGSSLFGSRSPFGQSSSNVFGQPSGFGQQQQSGGGVFGGGGGSSGGGFGQSAFGQPSGFGQSSSSLFGQSQSTFGGSGGGGGAFGSSTGGFGSSGGFGAQSQSAFGSGGFGGGGGGGGFGQSSGGGGLFGGQSSSGFGTFGQSSSAGFGGNSGNSLFGGQSASTGFGWGQSASSASGFGSGGGGGFGALGSTGGFGGQQDVGTRGIKWELTRVFEGGQSSTYYCIAMMPKFRSTKSLEELRVEDYMANAGQPSTQQNNQSTQSPFGAQSQSGFGANGGGGGNSLFGNSSGNAGFGQSSSSLFGGNSGSSFSGGFGQSSSDGFSSTGAFGNTGGMGGTGGFGNSGGMRQQSGGFGQSQSIGFGNSGFGGNTGMSSAAGFGQSTPAFGQSAGFGASASGFGNTSGFGQPNSSPFGQSSGFTGGNNAFGGSNASPPSNGLFGASSQPAFGAPSSGFGAPQSQSVFGAAAGSTGGTGSGFGLFGSQGVPNQSQGGFGFGSSTGGFGVSQSSFGQSTSGFGATPSFGAPQSSPFGGTGGFGANNGQLQQQQQQQQLVLVPQQPNAQNQVGFPTQAQPQQPTYGSVLYQQQQIQAAVEKQLAIEREKRDREDQQKNVKNESSIIVLPPPSLNEAAASRRRVSTLVGGLSNRTRTRGTVNGFVTGAGLRLSAADKRRYDQLSKMPLSTLQNKFPFFTTDRFLGMTEGSTYNPGDKTRRLSIEEVDPSHPMSNGSSARLANLNANGGNEDGTIRPQPVRNNGVHHSGFSRDSRNDDNPARVIRPNEKFDTYDKFVKRKMHPNEPALKTTTSKSPGARVAETREKFMWSSKRPSSWSKSLDVDHEDQFRPDKYLPYVSREGYYMRPSAAELGSLSMSDLQYVERFTVGRVGYGEVTWLEPTDVRGLDIDKCVDIGRGEVAVYPEKLALQLDAPARVTMWNMFKKNKKGVKGTPEAGEKYGKKLELFCEDNGLEFCEYDVKSGTWAFDAPGF